MKSQKKVEIGAAKILAALAAVGCNVGTARVSDAASSGSSLSSFSKLAAFSSNGCSNQLAQEKRPPREKFHKKEE